MSLTNKIKSIFGKDKDNSSDEGSSSKMASKHAVAKVGGTVIAETDSYEVVEGNIYFPPESIKKDYYTETQTHTTCPWKGLASYYTIDVDGNSLTDAAWFYPEPKERATNIKNFVAFYKNKVDITST